MKLRAGFLILFVFLFFASNLSGQNTLISLDKSVIQGELDNGLTYYIKHNKTPENRAQFWLITDAGAILEDPDQYGLAHFVEHMSFNGTVNFEKNQIIKYLQSIGMKFGPEINAYTVFDETVYMLQKVPIEEKENVDTSLQILYEWACAVAFNGEDIDDERGVIHEEWRTRRSGDYRMSLKYTETLFEGSRYGKQSVIGDIDIIDNFKHDVIRRFYKDWYRPDLQAIIAVGDFDVNEMELQIKERFSKIPKRENPRHREYFEVPFHKETKISIVTDPEARFTRVFVFNKHEAFSLNTEENYKRFLMNSLISNMVNQRFSERVNDKDAPFVYGGESFQNLRRTSSSWLTIGVAKSGKCDATLEALLLENEKIKRFGFSVAEFDIAKKELIKNFKNAYNERDKQKSSQFAKEYQDHFLKNNAAPGVSYEYNMALRLLDKISIQELNFKAIELLRDENRVVVITAPDSETLPSKEDIYRTIQAVKETKLDAPIKEKQQQILFDQQLNDGKIVEIKEEQELGFNEYSLSNGLKVIHKQTDFKEDEVLIYAFSKGGNSVVEDDKSTTASQLASIIYQSGIKDIKRTDLDKILAGKDVTVYPYLGRLSEGFQGSTSKDDLEISLQLIHLYFTKPRVDKEAFDALMAQQKVILENRAKNPNTILTDSVRVNVANYHPRARPMNVDCLNEISYHDIETIYRDRFADPNNFYFFFVGNISKDELEPLIEKYLGSLVKTERSESWKDLNIRPPKKAVKKDISIPMTVPKSTVYLSFNTEFKFESKNSILASMLGQIMDDRLTEIIREDQGGTYGVNIRIGVSEFPYNSCSANLMFDCAPEKAELLTSLVYEEIERIKKEGVAEKYIKNVQENKLKENDEQIMENTYWLDAISNLYFRGIDTESIIHYQDIVKKINNEDIIRFANLAFNRERAIEIIAYPAK